MPTIDRQRISAAKMFVFLIFEKSQTTLKHILEINNLAILQKESKLTKKKA